MIVWTRQLGFGLCALLLTVGCDEDTMPRVDSGAPTGTDAGPSTPGTDAGAPAPGTDAGPPSPGLDAGPPPVQPTHDCTPTRWVTNDADGAGDGSEAAPWTLSQAMAGAQAGDVVAVGPGIYTAPSTGERYAPAWNPDNSGTEGAPIVFCAEHPAVYEETLRSELRNDAPVEGLDASPAFGVNGREHIVWDGFYVNEEQSPSHPDTGPVVVWDSTDVTITHCVIDGATFERMDNHNGIRLEGVRRVNLIANRITGVHDLSRPNRNHAAIMTYDASFVRIEHNEISDCDDGMYIKGEHADDGLPNGAYTIRFNRIENILGHGITILSVIPVDSTLTDVSQNLLLDARVGILVNSVGDGHPAGVRVHHNTIVGSSAGVFLNAPMTSIDFHVTQNLFQGGEVFMIESFGDAELGRMIDNGYLSDDNHAFEVTAWGFGADLAAWQARSGLDAASSEGDPRFVDAEDYRLAPGSPALTAALDGGPVGCYVAGDEAIGVPPR